MNIDLGYGRRIENYRPGMSLHDTVVVVSPNRRLEVSLGGVLAQMPDLELPTEEETPDGGD